MGGGHAIQAALVNQREKETVAQLACDGFHIAVALTCYPAYFRLATQMLDPERRGEVAHRGFVAVGLCAAKVVVKVDRRNRQSLFER
jgi:hypothetical protein